MLKMYNVFYFTYDLVAWNKTSSAHVLVVSIKII